MRLWASLLLTIFLILDAVPLSSRQASIQKLPGYDPYIDEYLKKGTFSGVVLVAHDDKILFEKAYGLANIEFDVPNFVNTKFKIHSTTKPFTATAIMLLTQQGRLTLDDSITKYLPDAPKAWEGVAVRHLLSHMSGIPDFTNVWADEWEKTELNTLSKVLPKIRDVPLASKPGETLSYSNSGYELLGCIIEKVTGKTYPEFMTDYIFKPLGMRDTGIELPAPIDHPEYRGPTPVKRLAEGYNGKPGSPEISHSLMYGIMAAGGIYSTVEDLYRFDQALYSDRLLSARYREQMFAPAFTGKNGNGYGLGWMIRKQFNRRCLRHDGGTNGFISSLDRYPEDKATVIVVSNFGFFGDDLDSLRLGLAAIMFGEQYSNESR